MLFGRARRLVDHDSQFRELALQVQRWQQVHPCGQYRSLQHRMPCPVQTKVVTNPTGVDNAGRQGRAFAAGVCLLDPELVPSAGSGHNLSGHFFGREHLWQRIQRSDRRLRQQQHIVGDVKDALGPLHQVGEGGR